jgi:hypothetical protein
VSDRGAAARYLVLGSRRIRVPKQRWARVTLGMALFVRGLLPPFGWVLLPPAVLLLSIDSPRLRRLRRRFLVRCRRRNRR